MSTEQPVLIALGGNLGDVLETFRWALASLPALGVEPREMSCAYQTRPLTLDGGPWRPEVGPPAYWNAVCRVETALSPRQLLEVLHQLEHEAGRVRRERWESRVLDLDLLGYGTEVIDTDGLVVPHPAIAERRFVLMPLTDIAADWIEPRTGVSARTLLDALGDDSGEILAIEHRWTEGSQQCSS